jgi:hypothetical protein
LFSLYHKGRKEEGRREKRKERRETERERGKGEADGKTGVLVVSMMIEEDERLHSHTQ